MGSGHLLHVVLLTVPLFAVFRLNECSPSFNFQKARWVDLAFYFDSAEEYSSLSFATALFCFMILNAAKFFIPFDRVKRQPQAGWSAEVEGAASKRRKVFAVGHGGDEDRQAYISAYRHAPSVIAKVEAWQVTCSSLFAKSNPTSVYSPLRSVAGSSSSSSIFPNFPNCSVPTESASVFADYLGCYFFLSQPKALRSRARGYLSELRQATYREESHSSFSPAEFLTAATNLSSSTATGLDKVAYSMLKHLPRSGMDFLLIFNHF